MTSRAVAVPGGKRAMRNNAIGCAVYLAVTEGVGIIFSRMMAGNTSIELPRAPQPAAVI
jgi:import inner membrane translocase subunit TIM17